MGRIEAICVSDKKGVQKHCVKSARLEREYGIAGDAHAGNWHRQVSLLSYEKIVRFREKGADVEYGDFGENIVVSGIDPAMLPVGTRFSSGDVVLEMTQIGKECHTHCAIYRVMNDCIMPREGVFARVISGGELNIGDEITVLPYEKKSYTAAVITLSDKGAKGEREDISGSIIKERLTANGYEVIEYMILPDDKVKIESELINLADRRQTDLIVTTGGTGFSKRDVTPEATLAVAEKQAPGIAEAMRMYSLEKTKRAMLSRGVSVIRGNTLIINLPGSPKACAECLDCILETVAHGLDILSGADSECAR